MAGEGQGRGGAAQHRTGSVTYDLDATLLPGVPVADITKLRNVTFVVRGGWLMKR